MIKEKKESKKAGASFGEELNIEPTLVGVIFMLALIKWCCGVGNPDVPHSL